MYNLMYGSKFHSSRRCLIIIWTALNIKIGIVQKVYEWSNWPFAKMVVQWGSFWQKDSFITPILFELCLYWYLAQGQILGITLYLSFWWWFISVKLVSFFASKSFFPWIKCLVEQSESIWPKTAHLSTNQNFQFT